MRRSTKIAATACAVTLFTAAAGTNPDPRIEVLIETAVGDFRAIEHQVCHMPCHVYNNPPVRLHEADSERSPAELETWAQTLEEWKKNVPATVTACTLEFMNLRSLKEPLTVTALIKGDQRQKVVDNLVQELGIGVSLSTRTNPLTTCTPALN